MNVEELISSGQLELYVLGMLPPEEMEAVAQMAAQHPEVQAALDDIASTMEQFALVQATPPPPQLKRNIEAELFGPAPEYATEPTVAVREIPVLQPIRNNQRWAIAASLAAAIALGISTAYFYNQNVHMQDQLANLQRDNTGMRVNMTEMETHNQQMHGMMMVMKDEQTRRVRLNGMTIAPDAKAMVYWNKDKRATWIDPSGLPQIADNEQYQLWAIVDGKPVDLGVINKTPGFYEMKTVDAPQAFAITLEPMGGKASPTMEKMCVMGKI